AGEVVEQGGARELLEHPKHPYTQELLAACPRVPGLPRGVASEAWLDKKTSQAQDGSLRSRAPLPAEDQARGAEGSPLRPPSTCRQSSRRPASSVSCSARFPSDRTSWHA